MLRFKELRGAKTQEYVAKQVGITQRCYQNYESGARQADYETLIKIAKYFNVTIDYLLGASNAPYGEKGTYNIELAPESDDERKMLDLYREVKKRGGEPAAKTFMEMIEIILQGTKSCS